jgi:hypothetical protein
VNWAVGQDSKEGSAGEGKEGGGGHRGAVIKAIELDRVDEARNSTSFSLVEVLCIVYTHKL